MKTIEEGHFLEGGIVSSYNPFEIYSYPAHKTDPKRIIIDENAIILLEIDTDIFTLDNAC